MDATYGSQRIPICIMKLNRHHRYKPAFTRNLANRNNSDGSWTYTAEALEIFPRYLVLQAICKEVERFVPTDFTSLPECKSFLIACGFRG